MTTSTPTLADAIATASERAAGVVRVAFVARVEAYDRTTQTADVTPLVWCRDYAPDLTREVPEPRQDGVPCLFPGGAGVTLTWDYEAGDLVECVVMDASHDAVATGRTEPGAAPDNRRWSTRDAVVVGLYTPPGDPLPSAHVSAAGPVLRLPANRALRIGDSTAALALALAQNVAQRLAAIEGAINVLTLPVSGATAGPPTPIPFPVTTTTADVSTDLVLVAS